MNLSPDEDHMAAKGSGRRVASPKGASKAGSAAVIGLAGDAVAIAV